MRMTYNNTRPNLNLRVFSQGQLVIVQTLPDLNLGSNQQTVGVRLVPPGIREFDVNQIPNDWPLCLIKRRYSVPVVIGRGCLRARRNQYPMRHYLTTTAHRVIGQTCSNIATQISIVDPVYSLWESQQLLVIVSRVQNLRNILFVGDKADTLQAIRQLLTPQCPMTEHICSVVNAMDLMYNVADRREFVHYPIISDDSIPCGYFGCVFVAVSVKYNTWRLENYRSLRAGLSILNSVGFTVEHGYRPWVLAGFVVGFPENATENERDRADFHRNLQSMLHPMYTREAGSDLQSFNLA